MGRGLVPGVSVWRDRRGGGGDGVVYTRNPDGKVEGCWPDRELWAPETMGSASDSRYDDKVAGL